MVTFPKPYTEAEETECLNRVMAGDKSAREELIVHNLRLVTHVIKKYGIADCDIPEFISIGTIGLIKAIDSFDNRQGTKLVTYASRCINNEILMYLRHCKKYNKEISYNETVGTDKEGNEIHLFDIIESPVEPMDVRFIRKQAYRKAIMAVNNVLDKREKTIIVLRYGLDDRRPLTQKEIAKLFGISRSYISRIEKRALEKIRNNIE